MQNNSKLQSIINTKTGGPNATKVVSYMPLAHGLQDKCKVHPEYNITNFCMNEKCIVPCCPECIQAHIQSHMQISSVPQIKNVQTVKTDCIQHLNQLHDQYVQYQGKIANNSLYNHYIDQLVSIMIGEKKKIMKLVDQYFVSLEEKLKTNFKQNGEEHLKIYIQEQLLQQISSIEANISQLQDVNYIQGIEDYFKLKKRQQPLALYVAQEINQYIQLRQLEIHEANASSKKDILAEIQLQLSRYYEGQHHLLDLPLTQSYLESSFTSSKLEPGTSSVNTSMNNGTNATGLAGNGTGNAQASVSTGNPRKGDAASLNRLN